MRVETVRNLPPAAIALVWSIFPGLQGAALADVTIGGHVAVSTDYMFRGVSQTMSGPSIQAEIDVEFENGWYGYAWGSNVDYTDSGTPDDGAKVELDIGVGYVLSAAENTTLGFELTNYLFPGTKEGVDYNYQELQAFMTLYERHSLTIGYSNDVSGSGGRGIFYAINSGADLSPGLSLGMELGHYDLSDSYGTAYSYAELSVSGELKVIGWQLSYVTTTGEDEAVFYASTIEDRIVLELNMSF